MLFPHGKQRFALVWSWMYLFCIVYEKVLESKQTSYEILHWPLALERKSEIQYRGSESLWTRQDLNTRPQPFLISSPSPCAVFFLLRYEKVQSVNRTNGKLWLDYRDFWIDRNCYVCGVKIFKKENFRTVDTSVNDNRQTIGFQI